MFDANNRTLWIMATNIHSTARILLFASQPLTSAIFIDIYFQSLRRVEASVWLHVEISFCRPKKNMEISKLNAKSAGFYGVLYIYYIYIHICTCIYIYIYLFIWTCTNKHMYVLYYKICPLFTCCDHQTNWQRINWRQPLHNH